MPLTIRNMIFLNNEVYDLDQTIDSIDIFRLRHGPEEFDPMVYNLIMDTLRELKVTPFIDYDRFMPDPFCPVDGMRFYQLHDWFYSWGIRYFRPYVAEESEDAIESDEEEELVRRSHIDDRAFHIFIDAILQEDDIMTDIDSDVNDDDYEPEQ